MTRRDLVWAAVYSRVFIDALGPVGTPDTYVDETKVHREREWRPSPERIAHADQHARRLAQLASDTAEEREPR